MKLQVYIRQSWQIMLRDRQYSLIYIIGTALSMAFVMAFLMFILMSCRNIYPEMDRNRMLLLGKVLLCDGDGNPKLNTMVSPHFYELMKDAEIEGVESMARIIGSKLSGGLDLEVPGGGLVSVPVLYVDNGFWNVFQFDFVSGKAPSGEWNPALPEAVLSTTTALKCFGTDEAVGLELVYGGTRLRVCGVVKDVPITAMLTDAGMWLPEQMCIDYGHTIQNEPYIGTGMVCLLTDSRRDFTKARAGVEDVIARYNASFGKTYGMYISSSGTVPLTYLGASTDAHAGAFISVILAVVLLLMVIPAVNLSGMVSSSMEERIAEFGVRKAYGAPAGMLVKQVLSENFLLTLIGGVIGLFCAGGLLHMLSPVIESSKLGYGTGVVQADLVFPAEMVLRMDVYAAVFVSALLLNLFSSLVPVLRVLKFSVVDSLNEKR